MQGAKPVMQTRPVSFGVKPATQFSWNLTAQRAVLAAAFLFIAVLVFGAI